MIREMTPPAIATDYHTTPGCPVQSSHPWSQKAPHKDGVCINHSKTVELALLLLERCSFA